MMRFFYISLSYATFGIGATDNVIDIVAPIVGWMKGKTLQQIKPWLLSKKAKVIELKCN